jgi:hypothetical protein
MRYDFSIVPAANATLWFLGAVSLFLLALIGLFGYLAWSSRHSRFTVSAAGLEVRGDLYGRLVPPDVIVTDGVRRMDLRAERDRYPVSRRFGSGLPGFASGWFRLRNGEKALLYLTDRTRVVYVPTRKGYALLLSVERPDEFVRRLRDVARGG